MPAAALAHTPTIWWRPLCSIGNELRHHGFARQPRAPRLQSRSHYLFAAEGSHLDAVRLRWDRSVLASARLLGQLELMDG